MSALLHQTHHRDEGQGTGMGAGIAMQGASSPLHDAICSTIWAQAIFTIVHLRHLARQGHLRNDDGDARAILDPPISIDRVFHLADRNERLVRRFRDADYLELESASGLRRWFSDGAVDVHFVGDDGPGGDCAYGIARDSRLRRIILAFRGSITLNDWVQDFKLVISRVPNPLPVAARAEGDREGGGRTETVGIHRGFRNFLYGPPCSLLDAVRDNVARTGELGMKACGKMVAPIPAAATAVVTAADNSAQRLAEMLSSKNATDRTKALGPASGEGGRDDGGEGEGGAKGDAAVTEWSGQNHEGEGETAGGGEDCCQSDERDQKCHRTKLDIICEQLLSLKRKYPGDTIFVNGHSLGGALAQIASLSIAADPVLGSALRGEPGEERRVPVRCVAVANPKPGDRAFVDAVERLERAGRLECLCVHNHLDVVPAMPPNVAGSRAGFWHPGFRVLMHGGRHEVGRGDGSIPASGRVAGGLHGAGKKGWDWANAFSAPSHDGAAKSRVNLHDYRTYLERLIKQKDELGRLSFDGLYREMREEDCSSERPPRPEAKGDQMIRRAE